MSDTAQWITLVTVIVAALTQWYRENRQRKWDKEDRAELASKVVAVARGVSDKVEKAAGEVTAHAETENAKLASAIQSTHDKADDLAVKTETIRVQTNGNLDKVKAELAAAVERITSLQALTETLLAEAATRVLHDRRGNRT